jgi:ElaB/YqjD/DUF883 family membrane-anchored ribosome-binding protein
MKLSDRLLAEVKAQAVEIANLKTQVQYLGERNRLFDESGQVWRNRAETAEAQLANVRADRNKLIEKAKSAPKTMGELIKEKLGDVAKNTHEANGCFCRPGDPCMAHSAKGCPPTCDGDCLACFPKKPKKKYQKIVAIDPKEGTPIYDDDDDM